MEIVRSDDILGLLCDLAVLCGKKLGADGRIENVKQASLRFALHRACEISNEVADERLRNVRVHAVHGHMVAVVGGPAERNLGKVTRTDNEAARLVGDIHDDLRAFARLRVFKGNVVVIFIVSDILEVNGDRSLDIDGSDGRTERLCKQNGVALGSLRGAEARHGDGDDVLSVSAEKVHRSCRDQKRERRVETARNTDDGSLCPRVSDSLFERVSLNIDDAFGAFFKFILVGGNKGALGIFGRFGFLDKTNKRKKQIIRSVLRGISVFLHTFVRESLYVDDGGLHTRFEGLLFGKNFSALCDEAVTREHTVRGGFVRACVRIEVSANELFGGTANGKTSLCRSADDLRACGEIDDDICTCFRMGNRGRFKRHQIFSDLASNREFGNFGRTPKKCSTKRNTLVLVKIDTFTVSVAVFEARELASLVGFAVVRKIFLRNDSENSAVANGNCRIVYFVIVADGRADEDQHGNALGRFRDCENRLLCRFKERAMTEKIAAGVTRHAKLGKYQQRYALLICRADRFDDFLCVINGICHAKFGRDRRRFDKTVFHIFALSFSR